VEIHVGIVTTVEMFAIYIEIATYDQHIAEILGDPYVKMVPLPRIPNYRDLGRRQNPLSVRNSNIAEWTQVRKNLNMLNRQAELMTSQ